MRRLVVCGTAPQHEARAQQRHAAEQDRDGREARERQLLATVALGAGLDLACGLGLLLLPGRTAVALVRGAAAAARHLLTEDVVARLGRRGLAAVLRDGGVLVLAGKAAD